jgi:hypothetical protein
MTDMFGPDDPEGPPDYWQDRWAGTGEPEWWGETVRIYGERDGFFQAYDYTGEDWFNEVLRSQEELLELYGIDNIDIIHQLEQQGLWDPGGYDEPSADWAYWRELYEAG